ncbi:MAG: hypothetical protein HY746_07090 [Elusimicrobia bacterium]|nr:hypothetical protein [Elusimicrobiota bacterium]
MMLVIKLFSAVKDILLFAYKRPKDASIIILALLLSILFWRLNHEKNKTQEMIAKIEGLPPDTKQVVTIYRDCVVTKWRDGPTKIEYRDRYLPPEGHIEIVTKENESEKPPEVKIKDWGFTSRLGGGVVYSGKFLPLIDLKWAYWRRYSLTAGITRQFGGVGLSRHIDDFTPLKNLEILSLSGFDWNGKFHFGIGIRTNF